ncbi:MAG: hypothetical protein D6714_11545 [Bacteroidetes bacterium]|nr:MAG: hypothetical protein D6714_11545 [Bacteroidota bacterium]
MGENNLFFTHFYSLKYSAVFRHYSPERTPIALHCPPCFLDEVVLKQFQFEGWSLNFGALP